MRIGVIGAMEVEVELFKEQLSDKQTTKIAGMEFCSGTLASHEVIVVRSGVGKVDAAVCTQALIDRFAPDAIINTGIAGSLDNSLDIEDLVISTDCVQYDMDASALGYKLGEIPELGCMAFAADAHLRAGVLASAHAVASEIQAQEGRIVSGDRFIADENTKQQLVEAFGGKCCEMEGAAIAQAAWLNKTPFVVVRTISDKPGTEDQTLDYAAFETKAAHRCARIVLHMIETL